MNQPKVSIIMPVFNVEKYLRPCIESALAQTLKDIEIICVDDGSTDSSPYILDTYALEDSRVKVIHKENGGYGKAVNIGMDAATGEYFAILESDDVIHARMYETLYRIAKENDIDIIKSDFCRFTINEGVFNPENDKIANNPNMYGKVIEDEPINVLHNASLYTWSGIYKMTFLRERNLRHNETPGASYQDNGFWFLTMSKAKRVWFHDEVFYMLRRDNPNSSTQSREKVYCIRDEYDYILKELKKEPDLYKRVMGVYWWARFGSYRWSFNRIADEHKLEFAQHYAETMERARNAGEIDETLFSDKARSELDLLLKDYKRYYRRKKYVVNKMDRVRSKPTWFERLRWCYDDNGLWYTIKHTLDRPRLIIAKKLYEQGERNNGK